MASQSQLIRLLALIPYLLARQGADLRTTAAAFGVQPEQLRKDLEILHMCGRGQYGGELIEIDMEAVEGRGVIHLSNADYLSRPLRLVPDEALALVLALQYMRGLANVSLRADIDSALEKLRVALGPIVDEAGASVAGAAPHVKGAIDEAITEGRRLSLLYDGPRRYSNPQVEPARVFVAHGIGYLQAWSLDADDWRTYRLDRVSNAEVLPEAATRREPPLEPHDWNEKLPFTSEATLVVRPPAAWIAEYYPTKSVVPAADGTVAVKLGVTEAAWLDALLLRLGPGVAAVRPASASDGARAAARAALARYAGLDAGRVTP